MTIKAKILINKLGHSKYLYSYKLVLDANCTATHGKFLTKEDAIIHAEILARRIKVNLKWEMIGQIGDVCGVMGNRQPIQQRAESKL